MVLLHCNHFMNLWIFPGLPGWASTRKGKPKPIWISWSRRQWVAVGSARHMQICTLPQTYNHASTPPLSFLHAWCPSCHPPNSVKALKAYLNRWQYLWYGATQKHSYYSLFVWSLTWIFSILAHIYPVLVKFGGQGHRMKEQQELLLAQSAWWTCTVHCWWSLGSEIKHYQKCAACIGIVK